MTRIDRRDAAEPARAGGVAHNYHRLEAPMAHGVLTEEQRRHLLGDNDTPGLLDEYKVKTVRSNSGKPLIIWHCPREHGSDGTGHVGVICRDMEGDQTGLTLGELVSAVLDHEAEAH